HAVQRLSGALEKEIRDIKELLVNVLAETELFLDYSGDDGVSDTDHAGDEETGRLPGRPLAEEALSRLKTLAASWRRERLRQDGALAVIAGRPNAGKSRLFNLLIREERSIVTDIPGTTRDWIEAWISAEGVPIRLADTAGLRNMRGVSKADQVEKIGMERSRELLDEADLILYVIDGTAGITGEDWDLLCAYTQASAAKVSSVLALWNKADKVPLPAAAEFSAGGVFLRPLSVSAKTGEGIPALMEAISAALETSEERAAARGTSPGIAALRQKELIDAALAGTEEALALAAKAEPLDLIAPLLREAVNSLGEITGEVSSADILETMFSRFCVGK
ncbi:MAG: 50S ribosome-binding GTPase, partial [Spirochaetales bacterium]|nr:50S ribosome-binding GTPase [Spirochaetales bacterium]